MPQIADHSATLSVLACVSLALIVLSCGPHRGTSTIRETAPVDDHLRVGLEPCRVDGLDEMVGCGTLDVPEDPAAPEGRHIPLRIVVLPATGPDRAPDPIFVLTGGPGQAATERAAAFAEDLAMSRSRRDLVLIDQRGTGGSNPLRCRFSDGPGSGGITVEVIRRCRAELERVADLRRYTTPNAAADLEAVRRTLGYARINLDGGSYGTRLALVYIRAYPDRVRSAVLRGVSPTDFRNPLPFPRAGQRALEELFDACAADPPCAEAFPDLAASFDAVLARLDSGAVQVELPAEPGAEADARAEILVIDRDLFAERVHLVLFSADLSSRLPLLIHHAARGDYEPFARLASAFGRAVRDQIYFGMQLSVVCPEDVSRITDEDVERETAGTYLGRARIDRIGVLCAEWPSTELPLGYWDRVEAETPVLMVSGALDPSSPPRFAEEAARGLPNARHLLLAGASHIVRHPCINRIIAEFIEAGTTVPLDTACVREIRRPPFVLPG